MCMTCCQLAMGIDFLFQLLNNSQASEYDISLLYLYYSKGVVIITIFIVVVIVIHSKVILFFDLIQIR